MNPLESPIRREIVTLLREKELSAGDISTALNRPRPGISHHLSLLAEAGLITRRLSGPFRYYRLDVARTLKAWDDYLAETSDPASCDASSMRTSNSSG